MVSTPRANTPPDDLSLAFFNTCLLKFITDTQSRTLKEDKSKAEDIRQKALEQYSETKKRKSTENGDDCDEKPKRQRRSASTEPLVEFMQENYDNKS